jgi:hypothetical protein
MPYMGNIPAVAFSTMSYQDLTGVSGTNFTLDYPVGTPSEIEVFVNNVRQEPTVAYTVAGTALTMTGTVISSDDFYVNFQGKAQQTAVPGDGTVTQAMLSPSLSLGAGYFQGDNGATGDTTNGKGDIFRVHEQQLDVNVTIAGTDNALCAGPLTIATGVSVTVLTGGNLVIA